MAPSSHPQPVRPQISGFAKDLYSSSRSFRLAAPSWVRYSFSTFVGEIRDVQSLFSTVSTPRRSGEVARFFAGLYNDNDFPFDLTELRGLDADLYEHCIAVLRLDNNPLVEYIGIPRRQSDLPAQDVGLGSRKAPCSSAPPGDFHSAKLITISNAPGYRDAMLYDVAERSPPTELGPSAKDTERILSEFLNFHRLAWSKRYGRARPIDVSADEQRPGWLP